jgi:sugar-phosphatase
MPHYSAFLFDMDGTILSSIAAAERVWTLWAERNGIEVGPFLPTIHGIQAVETLRRQGLSQSDAEREAAAITAAELEDLEGIVEIPGASEFLSTLPADRWAVATSAPRALALRRLEAAGLPIPPIMICAEDAPRGKPAPDPFLLAAQQLGYPASDCLVFEDAPAGIQSAESAGADLMVVTALHTHDLDTPHPSLKDYLGVRVVVGDSGLELFFTNATDWLPISQQ